MKVKVGDKIEIVDARATDGKYKNGDILTIQQIVPIGVYVQEHNQLIWPAEFIVLQTFKKGDKVRVIDKPWNHPKWQSLTRETKKRHARHIGKEFEVATGNFLDLFGNKRIRACHENTFEALIVDLLEKVETEAQLTIEEKTREAHRIIGEIVAGFGLDEVFFFNCSEQLRTVEVYYMTVWSRNIEYNLGCGSRYVDSISLESGSVTRKTAVCAPADQYVELIGKMVALCKAVGRKLPEWV